MIDCRMVLMTLISSLLSLCFFFNDTATTEIYTLSLHDALPICGSRSCRRSTARASCCACSTRSEEHTSELQSPYDLVCRLLLEKKKQKTYRRRAVKNKKKKKQMLDKTTNR